MQVSTVSCPPKASSGASSPAWRARCATARLVVTRKRTPGFRRPSSSGQFGARIETPELGGAKLALAGYAMRVHSREPIVSIRTGTLGGLLQTTAPDYTSSGSYFVGQRVGTPHRQAADAEARRQFRKTTDK